MSIYTSLLPPNRMCCSCQTVEEESSDIKRVDKSENKNTQGVLIKDTLTVLSPIELCTLWGICLQRKLHEQCIVDDLLICIILHSNDHFSCWQPAMNLLQQLSLYITTNAQKYLLFMKSFISVKTILSCSRRMSQPYHTSEESISLWPIHFTIAIIYGEIYSEWASRGQQ